VSGYASRRAELGQHFLAGAWLAAELAEQAGVGAGDLVVEIGAGTGVLTEALARRAGRVVAIEYDPRLAERGAAYDLGTGRRLGPACFRPRPRVGAAVLVARRRRPPLVPAGGTRRFAALLGDAFRHPGLPLRRGLVPPFTYRQLRRLARELGFGLDARPADLDAVQWAGLYAFLARPSHLGRRAQSP
jgi:16S rRNA A1518/A1519 N6-dimethyltransferase RsmA/KsgA/DIM1 with predicted DNA glycosylase/AP lyase activity